MERTLATKLFIPPTRRELVTRRRLLERLDRTLQRKLSLISAPAGFGKTTLVTAWLDSLHPDAKCDGSPATRVAWLSLDEDDNDLKRFLTYFVHALSLTGAMDQSTVKGILSLLASPQPPAPEAVLSPLISSMAECQDNVIFVLDDYHVIENRTIHDALTFILDHQPRTLHLVIATREDPHLPLSRLRANDQLTELRAADLRFTLAETAGFLNQVMGLNLSPEDVHALEARTEGWIAGLQLAAISLQGYQDTADFIKSFTGSHHYVMDYLVEEVLQQQPESVQEFLLRTSCLERLCGSLCEAVLQNPSVSGQETLEYLERANLFIIPLDNQRRWYRYHHLFTELLRQRLQQSATHASDGGVNLEELHRRASEWFEDNSLDLEAFHHAAAANDYERAERLIEGKGMPLQFRGALVPILNWLKSLPEAALDERPSLWSTYASVLLATGQTTNIEAKLQAAERCLENAEENDKNRDLIGRIAATRAMLALSQQQAETIIAQSQRALEYLHPGNLPFRTSTISKLAYAYLLQGDRYAASKAYAEAVSIAQESGNMIIEILASIGLGSTMEMANQLEQAKQTYRRVLRLAEDIPFPLISEAHLGLARIYYEWNKLPAAREHAHHSLPLAKQLVNTDRTAACTIFLARLALAQGELSAAIAILAEADEDIRFHNYVIQMPEAASLKVLLLLRQGKIEPAAQLAESCDIPMSRARVWLAQGKIRDALELLESLRRKAKSKDWQDELLKIMIQQTLALQASGENDKSQSVLGKALKLAEPGGFIRIFVDEGQPMAHLLSETTFSGDLQEYVRKLLAAFKKEQKDQTHQSAQSLIDPLSPREMEIMRLIAQGLSNREIGERLFLAVSTIKGHNQIIFDKLQVKSRTEAIARSRQLGLI